MSANYILKAKVLNEHQDILQLEKRHSRLMYLSHYTDTQVNPDVKEAVKETVFSFLNANPENEEIWQEAYRINHAKYERSKRLRSRISYMLEQGTCFFVTLTFSNDTLATTSDVTRRRYVTRFLKSHSSLYVANIDFGDKNGREHYHAVVLCDAVDKSSWEQYGFIHSQMVRNNDDAVKLGKYISKLTNHALKVLIRGQRGIYSRF